MPSGLVLKELTYTGEEVQALLDAAGAKVTEWQTTPDDNHYPSEKLVKDSLNAQDKIFVCTYGTTKASEVAAALTAGKMPVLYYSNKMYVFAYVENNYYYFYSETKSVTYQARLNGETPTWVTSSETHENTTNKKGNVADNASSTTYYPTTKAVADYAEAKGNKVTAWQTTPDNTHYPSEKLVYDEIGNVEDVLDAILGSATLPTQRKVEIASASGTTLSADENKYYAFSDEVGTLAITLPAPSDLTHLTCVVFAMTTGSSPAVTFSATAISGTTPPIYAQDGFAIEASTSYEVNAIFNGASWVLALIKIATNPILSSSSSSSE